MRDTKLASGMGIWFEQQLVDMLTALRQTSGGITTLLNTEQAQLYQAGFDAAINAMAVGIVGQPLTAATWQELDA